MRQDYYQRNKDKWRKYYETRRKKAPLYATWQQILTRTGHRGTPKDHEIKDYILRGIDVCDEWLDYCKFENWALSHGWQPGLQVDRIDNDKGYYPDNCRCVTASQNQRNRRDSPVVFFRGSTMLLGEAYEILELEGRDLVNYKLAAQRVKKLGWDAEKACATKPIHY